MKKTMMLLGVLILSVSCVEINGTLQVREAMNVKKKSGFLNTKTKIVTAQPGAYRAELKIKSSKNINLQLKGGSVGNIDVPLKSDDSLNIPANGQFYIEGRQIGQPFSISGVIRTDVDHYGYANELVKCEISRIERQCEKVCNHDTQRCEVICKDVTVTFQGYKDVAFHYMRTSRQATLEFMPENSNAVVAVLPASGIETQKIVDRESLCR